MANIPREKLTIHVYLTPDRREVTMWVHPHLWHRWLPEDPTTPGGAPCWWGVQEVAPEELGYIYLGPIGPKHHTADIPEFLVEKSAIRS